MNQEANRMLYESKRDKRGFTLIELLVVIAIIAILAAILFPVFARAKKQARLTTCASNLREIGMAVLMYADDHGGRLPRVCVLDANGHEDWTSVNSTQRASNATYQDLKGYVKSDKIYDCPEECSYEINARASGVPYQIDYRFNDMMNYSVTSDPSYTVGPKTLGSCTLPRKFYIVQDRHSTHHFAGEDESGVSWIMVTVMADGHVDRGVRPYAAAWRDKLNGLKYYHWDFPKCHQSTDPQVAAEYY